MGHRYLKKQDLAAIAGAPGWGRQAWSRWLKGWRCPAASVSPWFYFPDLLASGLLGAPSSLHYSGWVTAVGIPFVRGTRLAFFVHLWLVPLTAVALLALALLYMQRRFSARLTLGVLVALSVLALLVELGFYWEVVMLGPALFNGEPTLNGGPSAAVIGVEWGVWAAVAVNVAAIAACVYLLRSSRFADIETGGSLPGQ